MDGGEEPCPPPPREPRDCSTSPTRNVLGPDLDSGASAKGRQQSRREETLMCSAEAPRPVEEGGWGGGPAATQAASSGSHKCRYANVAHPFDDIVVAVVQLRFKHLQVAHLRPEGANGTWARDSSS